MATQKSIQTYVCALSSALFSLLKLSWRWSIIAITINKVWKNDIRIDQSKSSASNGQNGLKNDKKKINHCEVISYLMNIMHRSMFYSNCDRVRILKFGSSFDSLGPGIHVLTSNSSIINWWWVICVLVKGCLRDNPLLLFTNAFA